jgi:SAM-dependent methyltransferase
VRERRAPPYGERMAGGYDAEHIAAFFDDYGDRERERHDSPAERVALAVHADLLAEFVRPGDLVLDAGAGPGRFTVELAALGARVHVGDISPVQLEANRLRVGAAGWESAVVARERLDIADLSGLPDARFDAVVAFGGPLSYVRDRADAALAELVRVTRPGGHVLLSVMSTLGAMRALFTGLLAEHRAFGPQHSERIFTTGELDRDTNAGHEMRMFRWAELERLAAAHAEVVTGASANFLTADPHPSRYADLTDDEWERVVSWERRLCREPGVRDAGTHILIVLRRPG